MTKQLTEQDLLNLKGEIDEAKTKVSELNGQKTALMNQLKTDFGCKTPKEAEKKLTDLKKEITTLENEIEEGTKELSEKYNIQ